MEIAVCASLQATVRPARAWCCGIAGLREVQLVRVRKERRGDAVLGRRGNGLERRQQLWIGGVARTGWGYGWGTGHGRGRVRSMVVVATSRSAEGTAVEERNGSEAGIGWSLEELAEGRGVDEQGKRLVHALRESASVILAELEKRKSLASTSWFPPNWFPADKNAWMKSLSYQSAVHALLKSVIDIAAQGQVGNRSVRVFVIRRLLEVSSPLEDSIRHELSSRDPAADDWLWLQQHPLTVSNFVSILEGGNQVDESTPYIGGDVELLKFALSMTSALLMLGSAPVSNPLFSSALVQGIFDLMEKLQESISMNQVYQFCWDVGLKQEFLEKFGHQAADDNKWRDAAEGEFWVYLVHQLLREALIREGVRLRIESRDSIEILEKDLAVFGFFAVLGRRTRAYLASKGVSVSEESLENLLRYLEGGSVLFYPQLAKIPVYQLFIEVVCEEMEWLPFYPVSATAVSLDAHEEDSEVKSRVGKVEKLLAIAVSAQVCSLWVKNFVEHNVWIRQPEGTRAATFLLKSQQRLDECNEVYELVKRSGKDNIFWNGAAEAGYMDRLIYQGLQERSLEKTIINEAGRFRPDIRPSSTNEQLAVERENLQEVEQLLKSVDKEMQTVNIALAKLELLVKELEVTSSAESERSREDLDKIKSLKQDVEVFRASLKSEASAKEMRILELQAELEMFASSKSQPQVLNLRDRYLGTTTDDSSLQFQRRRSEVSEDKIKGEAIIVEGNGAAKSAKTFELLMTELAELEFRIQQSVDQSASLRSLTEEEWNRASVYDITTTTALARINENVDLTEHGFFAKSIEKLKSATLDIWRGSCLLGTDVGVSLVLLRRKVLGQNLTSREKKILKRTVTDMVSVVPIGFLMLLPVTAVGHAAILAAIQKYVPGLIPSAYGPQRLDVLRRLEQLRKMEPESPEPVDLSSSRNLDSSLRKEVA
nr:uncharacterized protein LOC112272673 isoform X2 [Physcomitrium patens]|eukprot:XP_024356431.1 uncharacterized protein LOC112272673 isoform X2 [Physcomitrella patens]